MINTIMINVFIKTKFYCERLTKDIFIHQACLVTIFMLFDEHNFNLMIIFFLKNFATKDQPQSYTFILFIDK